MNAENILDLIRENRAKVIPIAIAVVLLVVNIGFGVAVLLPKLSEHDDLQSQVTDAEQILTERNQVTPNDSSGILQRQIDAAQDDLQESASVFLTDAEADDILDSLYQYATLSDVKIVDIQSQEPEATNEVEIYGIRRFHVQVDGEFALLINFMIRFREASVPTVTISDLIIQQGENLASLTMTIELYTSPFAAGDVFANLPDTQSFALITPFVPTVVPATPTPEESTPEVVASPQTTDATPSTTLQASTPAANATAAENSQTETIEATATPEAESNPVGPGIYDDNNSAIHYTGGQWETISSQRGYGGGYHYSADEDAQLEFAFVSTDIAVQFVAFRNFGIFEIYVDDQFMEEVDSYAVNGVFGQLVTISGLDMRLHTLTVRNTGRRNDESSDTVIAIDAIHVLEPVLEATPSPE